MTMLEALKARRSVYDLTPQMPVAEDAILSLVAETTRLVPDAFNMRSQRVITLLGERSRDFWDLVFDTYAGRVSREKCDRLAAGAGTVLFFTDDSQVTDAICRHKNYAGGFPVWAEQSAGMLQFAIWSGLAELGVGANLQHYNPAIDVATHLLVDAPPYWRLIAQMPFGGIATPPDPKDTEDINRRVWMLR